MKRGFATIWDGIAYRQVSHEEAEKLEKEDKCQNLSGRIHSATELKFRRDFTGYKTREIRAAPPSAPATPPPTPPAADDDVAEPVQKVNRKDWKSFKKAAAKEIGKTFQKTTKAETIAYMEKHFGLED